MDSSNKAPTQSQLSVNSVANLEIKVTKYRWTILFIIGLVTIMNFMQMLQFSIIANIITKFYNVESYWVDMTTLIFFVSYILFFYPVSYLIEKHNLKWTVVVATALTLAGSVLKIFAPKSNLFWLILLAQFLIALGQVQLCSLPSKLATTWFGAEEVSTACAIVVLGMQLGSGLGCIQSPFLVKGPDNDTISLELYDMFLYQAIATGCIFVLVLICTYPINKCKVTLKNADLWKKFHNLETEMIITKSGRRMFPSLQVQLAEIDPQAQYCVFMEMVPASRCRYKYSSAGGWAPAGSEEAQSPHRIYLHPESPAKGEYWMSQPISFGRVKLTNMPAPPAGQIVLSSMHKYQPRIIVVKSSDPRTASWSPSTCAAFPETQFIAVTAYQNEKITQLKIDNNPFAKGFRHNGQAKCKRKRACEEKEDELISVDDFEENNNSISDSSIDSIESSSDGARSRSSSFGSPLSEDRSPSKRARIEDSLDATSRRSPTCDGFAQAPFPVTPQVYLPPPVYPYYPLTYMPTASYGGYYYPYGRYFSEEPQSLFCPPNFVEVKKPRKITDFSIRALIGC